MLGLHLVEWGWWWWWVMGWLLQIGIGYRNQERGAIGRLVCLLSLWNRLTGKYILSFAYSSQKPGFRARACCTEARDSFSVSSCILHQTPVWSVRNAHKTVPSWKGASLAFRVSYASWSLLVFSTSKAGISNNHPRSIQKDLSILLISFTAGLLNSLLRFWVSWKIRCSFEFYPIAVSQGSLASL